MISNGPSALVQRAAAKHGEPGSRREYVILEN